MPALCWLFVCQFVVFFLVCHKILQRKWWKKQKTSSIVQHQTSYLLHWLTSFQPPFAKYIPRLKTVYQRHIYVPLFINPWLHQQRAKPLQTNSGGPCQISPLYRMWIPLTAALCSRLALPREMTLFFLEPKANVTLSPGIRLRGSGDRSRCPFGVSVLIFGSIGWVGDGGWVSDSERRRSRWNWRGEYGIKPHPPLLPVLQTAAVPALSKAAQRGMRGTTLRGEKAAFLSSTYHLAELDSSIQVYLFFSTRVRWSWRIDLRDSQSASAAWRATLAIYYQVKADLQARRVQLQ